VVPPNRKAAGCNRQITCGIITFMMLMATAKEPE